MKTAIGVLILGGLATAARADLVMDQIGSNPADLSTTNIFASQDFEAAFDAFDINAIDDFTVSSGRNLTSVDAVFGGFNGFTTFSSITNYRVEVYGSIAAGAGNLVGNIGHQVVAAGSVTVNTSYLSGGTGSPPFGLVTIPINITLPSAGTYWIGVMGENNFAASGEVGPVESTFAGGFPNGTNAFQVNPSNGFSQGTSFQITGQFPSAHPVNLAYRVTAAPVPEPMSMTAIAMGIGALAVRRRRNRR